MADDVIVITPTAPPTVVLINEAQPGPQGAQGIPGDSLAFEFHQAVAASLWPITHNFGRRPTITVYVGGVMVNANYTADATTAQIAFNSPTTGYAVLT